MCDTERCVCETEEEQNAVYNTFRVPTGLLYDTIHTYLRVCGTKSHMRRVLCNFTNKNKAPESLLIFL